MNLLSAQNYLKASFLCGGITIFGMPILVTVGMPFPLLMGLIFIAFVLFHVFLGMSAKAAGRSWVYFGLLPALWPAIGGLISSTILYFSLRKSTRNISSTRSPWVSAWPTVMTLICIIIVSVAVPLAGQKFENWPKILASAYAVAVFCLPIFSLVGVFQSIMLLQDGHKKPKTFIFLFVCSLGLLTFITYVAAFTHAP